MILAPIRSISLALIWQVSDKGPLLWMQPRKTPQKTLWEFPGGKINGEETPQQALLRELEEEVGIVVPYLEERRPYSVCWGQYLPPPGASGKGRPYRPLLHCFLLSAQGDWELGSKGTWFHLALDTTNKSWKYWNIPAANEKIFAGLQVYFAKMLEEGLTLKELAKWWP